MGMRGKKADFDIGFGTSLQTVTFTAFCYVRMSVVNRFYTLTTQFIVIIVILIRVLYVSAPSQIFRSDSSGE